MSRPQGTFHQRQIIKPTKQPNVERTDIEKWFDTRFLIRSSKMVYERLMKKESKKFEKHEYTEEGWVGSYIETAFEDKNLLTFTYRGV